MDERETPLGYAPEPALEEWAGAVEMEGRALGGEHAAFGTDAPGAPHFEHIELNLNCRAVRPPYQHRPAKKHPKGKDDAGTKYRQADHGAIRRE